MSFIILSKKFPIANYGNDQSFVSSKNLPVFYIFGQYLSYLLWISTQNTNWEDPDISQAFNHMLSQVQTLGEI